MKDKLDKLVRLVLKRMFSYVKAALIDFWQCKKTVNATVTQLSPYKVVVGNTNSCLFAHLADMDQH